MSGTDAEIGFAQLGLGSVLKQNQLAVPPNQREYAWEQKEVRTLFRDFARAIAETSSSYFLGTIVTIPRSNGLLEVVDGQQRLATTAILLSAIRDYIKPLEPVIAESVENEFLTVIDRTARGRVPRLTLNLDDNDYFRARLNGAASAPEPRRLSHRLLGDAFDEAAAHVSAVVSGFDEKDHGDILNHWLTFIESKALVILLRVPNAANAYKMFETLNDRGKRTSQSDLIKNFLLGQAADRLPEVQQRWSYMRGALETLEDEDTTIIFLRHALCCIRGFVRESALYESVQSLTRGAQPAVTFSGNLERLASAYVATYNHESEAWNRYSDSTRRALEVLNLFDIKPMRPLMLAIAQQLDEKEAAEAYTFCVSMGVRLMITNSTRTGTVEEGLAGVSHEIFKGAIATASKMRDALTSITPSDERFIQAFESATVSNGKLARYYLRSLELVAKGEREPWHIPNDDRGVINLEHVLPQKPGAKWPSFSDEEAKLFYKKIGNLALLRASQNSDLKSDEFSEKKIVYARSPYVLTSQIAEFERWDPVAITERQKSLAPLALKTWRV